MRSDILVVGDEIDGLIGALRLLQAGCSVRVLASGLGSLHYGTGALQVLGYLDDGSGPVLRPLEAIGQLGERHPYALITREPLQAALAWLEGGAGPGFAFSWGGENGEIVSLSGRGTPAFATAPFQATTTQETAVVIVRFRGHREFPAALLRSGLEQMQVDARVVEADPPPGPGGNSGIARSFDRLSDLGAWFRELGRRIGSERVLVLFPAVLGLDRHREVMRAAEQALGCLCREVPTLPPSVPGQRLSRWMISGIQEAGGLVHMGNAKVTAEPAHRGYARLGDGVGRSYEAPVVLLSSGGVLMGGLQVAADGVVREPVFDLPVHQTQPLDQSPAAVVTALHRTGVEVEPDLRPRKMNGAFGNVLVTGRMLAHWDPVAEGSDEGVAIATGWAAADTALRLLGR